MSTIQKLIYFGRPPLEIYGDGHSKTDHNFGDKYFDRMRKLNVTYVTCEFFPAEPSHRISGCSMIANNQKRVHHARGITILYEIMPGRQIKVELTFEDNNPHARELEALLLAQDDILPSTYNELVNLSPKI